MRPKHAPCYASCTYSNASNVAGNLPNFNQNFPNPYATYQDAISLLNYSYRQMRVLVNNFWVFKLIGDVQVRLEFGDKYSCTQVSRTWLGETEHKQSAVHFLPQHSHSSFMMDLCLYLTFWLISILFHSIEIIVFVVVKFRIIIWRRNSCLKFLLH